METKTKQRIRINAILKAAICGVLIIAAIVSFTKSAKMASVDTYQSIIESIDEKKTTVTALVTASTMASLGVSAIPDDTGSAISEQIAELGTTLGIVLIVLYLEKYLLPILGGLYFRILLPVSLGFIIGAILFPRTPWLKRVGAILFAVGIASFAAIPTSVYVSDRINEIYHDSIQQTITMAEETSALEEMDETETQSEPGKRGILSSIGDGLSNIADAVTSGASHALEKAEKLLNHFVEATAVLIVTHCVIPVIVVLFYVFLIKQILGAFNIPSVSLSPNALKRLTQSLSRERSIQYAGKRYSDFDNLD